MQAGRKAVAQITTKDPRKMTAAQIQAETAYRISERISILCEDRPPTPEQLAIAHEESREWQRRYLAEQVEQRELL